MSSGSALSMETAMIARAIAQQIAPAGGRALELTGADEPSLVVLHPAVGLVAIDIDDSGGDLTDQAPFVALNQKVHSLRQTLRIDAATAVGRVVLHPDLVLGEPHVGVAGRTRISRAQLADASWLTCVPAAPLGPVLEADVTAKLFPELTFTSAFRKDSHDARAGQREQLRYSLDAQQALIAQREDLELGLIQGPPGSGKSLVLAARARWLAERNPDWRIRLLCFNRALVPYLRSLTDEYANIKASLFTAFAQELGVRFSFSDDSASYRGLAQARTRGIPPIADAILIDEVQDFRPPWLVIAYEGLVRRRGGFVMAGDSSQALYHDEEFPKFIRDKGVEVMTLERPYRSTRNILEASGELNARFAIASSHQAPEGEPVELIWAGSWDEQAKAVAWEINLMVSNGDRRPGDIGVLVTTKWGTFNRFKAVLPKYDIPFTIVDRDNASEFDRTSDTVKIMTVHSAKGHEFPVVFLFGLEALPAFDPADGESVRRARVGFVGATRAKDQLMITYTRDNEYLTILSKDDAHVRRWVWPDNYEGVASDG